MSDGIGDMYRDYENARKQLATMTKELKIAKEFQATAVSERYKVWFKLDAMTKERDAARDEVERLNGLLDEIGELIPTNDICICDRIDYCCRCRELGLDVPAVLAKRNESEASE